MEKKTKGHKGAIDEASQGKSRQVEASRCEFGLSQVEAEYRRVRTECIVEEKLLSSC